jgi:hypothetical protein
MSASSALSEGQFRSVLQAFVGGIERAIDCWSSASRGFLKPTSWAFYRHDAGSDVDLDILGDLELLLGIDVQHLEKPPLVEIWWDLKFVKSISLPKKFVVKGKCALTT